MPLIKSAIKKMRKDRVRTKHNLALKTNLKNSIKKARKEPSQANLQAVFSRLDKAVKTNLIHANKASRLKSRLSKGNSETGMAKKAAKKKASIRKVTKKS